MDLKKEKKKRIYGETLLSSLYAHNQLYQYYTFVLNAGDLNAD